jgi:NADPH:quinone reductase-like Zn-dependent oxidoreductase
MKAVFLKAYGGVEQLIYEDAPEPVPSADEVLVKVFATSINPIDFKLRSGHLQQLIPLELPAILGRDVAGEVVSVGANVKQFKAGDKVLGLVNHSYAEYLVAKPEALALIPKGLAMEQAAVIPLVALTGAQLIEKGVKLRGGQRVLVTGALGAVGRAAVYVAKVHGAVVIAGVRASQLAQSNLLGADKVIALDDQRAFDTLAPLDGIADTVGGSTLEHILPRLKKGGKLGTVVGKPADLPPDIELSEVWVKPDSKRLAALAEDVRVGDLVIPIGKRFPLSEIRQAQSAAEKGGIGKVLVTI